jgi:hypothetical protein
MICRCDCCDGFFKTSKYEYYCSDKCMIDTEEKERAAMIDDSNCHCPPCTAMNEPLSLEGDIRYLKAHIETKDRQLAEANLRIDIYKEAWQDAEKNNTHLRQKLDEMHQLAMTRLNDNMGLAQENEKLREQILDLEQSNRDLKGVMNSIRHWLDKSITHIDDWSENG